ncbi:MAG: HIT domain-containing protein [Candidatus Melainabacteria bacterium]|nr:HIT domain-containing protein [Candidatus Melainabacteria bacterium]
MQDPGCLFCKIVAGDIPAEIVFKNEVVTAFRDIQPQAPTHVLVVPNVHVASFAQVEDPGLMQAVWCGVQQVTQHLGLTDYRLVVNTGAEAGQTVFHWHVHILAGRALAWPPG